MPSRSRWRAVQSRRQPVTSWGIRMGSPSGSRGDFWPPALVAYCPPAVAPGACTIEVPKEGTLMKAKVGDWLVIKGATIDQPDHRGLIIEVRSSDGSPPYVVRWLETDHVATVIPGPDAVVGHCGGAECGRRAGAASVRRGSVGDPPCQGNVGDSLKRRSRWVSAGRRKSGAGMERWCRSTSRGSKQR